MEYRGTTKNSKEHDDDNALCKSMISHAYRRKPMHFVQASNSLQTRILLIVDQFCVRGCLKNNLSSNNCDKFLAFAGAGFRSFRDEITCWSILPHAFLRLTYANALPGGPFHFRNIPPTASWGKEIHDPRGQPQTDVLKASGRHEGGICLAGWLAGWLAAAGRYLAAPNIYYHSL